MTVDISIISIGALSKNPFWGEKDAVRTPHATTTLIRSGKQTILVDPSLPATVLDARLFERAGIRNKDITTVFLTTFRAAHRAALSAFDQATWYVHEREKEYVSAYFAEAYKEMTCECHEHRDLIEIDMKLLKRCRKAPDELADQVELFPSPGVSAGCCGLLLTPPVGATVIAGDAILNKDYLEHGQVWEESYDLNQARKSLQDILEVAEIIVPGHDNLIPLLGKML